MSDARRLDDVTLKVMLATINAGSGAAASVQSGNWFDLTPLDDDVVVVVNVGSVTGGFGNIAVQLQVSAAATGAAPSNIVDPRGSLLNITALGTYAIAVNSDDVPAMGGGPFGLSSFLGFTTTFTTVTAAVMSAWLVGRGDWNSGSVTI